MTPVRRFAETVRDRSTVLLTLNYLAGQLLYRCGARTHKSGTTHRALSVPESIDYIHRVFDDYLRWGNLSSEDLLDKTVLEVGPGDNLGVALLFASHGARRVVCLDRFHPEVDQPRNRQIYEALLRTLDPTARARAEACLSADRRLPGGVIEYRSGIGIEDALRYIPAGGVDLIVSRAVMQHVADVNAAWNSMDRLLSAHGMMLHKIDFRSHGYYESLHPLKFLTIPQWVWKWISAPDPTLNRARVATYRRLASRYAYSCETWVTNVVSRKQELRPPVALLEKDTHFTDADLAVVESIKKTLQEPFRSAPTEELLISGMFLAARKR